ncbi:MAG: AraC family transcriptional regulator [Clostridiales bacterium]|jgi:AraC-like DNA-binding protein|nr:AraC family transcriptional regulator [Clostridiales bacterium]
MLKITNYVQRIATAEWAIPEYVIDFHDLTFIYKGEAVYTVNGKPHKVSAGTLLYIPPGSTRSAYTFAENPMHSFALNLVTDDASLLRFPTLKHAGIDEQLVDLYLKFDKAWLLRDKYFKLKTKSYLTLILCRINELQALNAKTDRRIERAKEYVLANYQKPVSLKQAAEREGLNGVYFGALFKKNTGQSFNRYVNAIRINKAKDLLADGNSVADTSLMCGFDNIFYFSGVFKKIMGKSPIHFKK